MHMELSSGSLGNTSGYSPSVLAGPSKPGRLASLDIFRGITVAAMLLVNNSGKGEPYAVLEHAPWHGWTPTDLVFPFFLFIVGVAIPFSLAGGRGKRAGGRGPLLGLIWLRSLSLFMLGQILAGFPVLPDKPLPDGFESLKIVRMVAFCFCCIAIIALLVPWPWRSVRIATPIVIAILFYGLAITLHYLNQSAIESGWPTKVAFGNGVFNPDRMRIPGVLQRIGICYGVAASIALFAGTRWVMLSIFVLFGVYSGLMLAAQSPGHVTGSLTKEDNFARMIDVAVFDRTQTDAEGNSVIVQKHSYEKYPDNEGLLSTLPAIGTSLIGVLVGIWLCSKRPPVDQAAALLAMAVPVTILGACLDQWLMPINKNLWTPSFAIFTAGLAMFGLGFVHWLADVRGYKAWGWPFLAFGMNAILAFVLGGLVVRLSRMIKVPDPTRRDPVGFLTYADNRIAEWVGQASDALHNSVGWLPKFDTPQNTSLAYAVAFVLALLIPLAVLKLCRVFVKV